MNTKQLRYIFLALCLTIRVSIHAQQQPDLALPAQNELINPSFNPAMNEIACFATYDIAVTPLQVAFTAGALWTGLTNNHHYGLAFRYSGLSFARLYDIEARYGYTWTIAERHQLSLGGLLQVNASHVLTRPDLGLGLTYRFADWTLAVSARNLIGSAWTDSTSMILNERRIYAYTDYFGRLNGDRVALVPHLLLWYGTHSVGIDLGLNAHFLLTDLTKSVHSVYLGYTCRAATFYNIVEAGISFPASENQFCKLSFAYFLPNYSGTQTAQVQFTYTW